MFFFIFNNTILVVSLNIIFTGTYNLKIFGQNFGGLVVWASRKCNNFKQQINNPFE